VSVRQEANRAILAYLSILVEEQPDSRFGQILVNSGIISTHNNYDGPEPHRRWADDPFFDESTFTLTRMLLRSDT
jgi:hypothetical protein